MFDGTTSPPLVFFHTSPMPCPYLPGRMERRLVADISGHRGRSSHDLLARAGFRRTQSLSYRPACPECTACLPIRIRTEDFRWTRSFRRILRRNRNLTVTRCDPRASAEQYALFRQYQKARHSGGDMSHMNYVDYVDMIEQSPIPSQMLEYRDIDSNNLVAAMLVDLQDDGFSAVYSFYSDKDQDRSLGIYMVLDLIKKATAEDLPYVYLGYWIAESRKMSYKTRFRPAEILRGSVWTVLDESPGKHDD